MSYLKGEDINIGIGMEDPAARGVFVTPQNFIPGRTPTGINADIVKALMKETMGSGMASQGAEVVQRKALGDLEFNVRNESIGYILKSLLGKCVSTVKETTAYDHVLTVLTGDAQYPSLSLALSQLGFQHYAYNGALATKLSIKTPVDDLVNATAEFIALDEAEHADFTPAFQADDYIYRPQDITIKLATNLAGLDAANAINVKEFSIDLSNAGKPQHCLGSVSPSDNLAGILEAVGNMILDYADDTYHDLVKNGTYQAMRIELQRSDITIGATSHPTIRIDLSRVSFDSNNPDRPIDDVVKDNLSFTAHGTIDSSEPIEITITNEMVDYLKA